MTPRLAFALPPELEAHEPPEARRLSRDGVRMLVAHRDSGELIHTKFRQLPDFLEPGDLVVINTSGVLAAELDGLTPLGDRIVVHLSTKLTTDRWVVEFRSGQDRFDGVPPTHVELGEGASLDVIGPYRDSDRLFIARLSLPLPDMEWISANGRPIRYRYVDRPWPIAMYQNVYATEPGSAEMPSAGRPFTPQVITRLVAKGVLVAPIVLHTGVASLEANETPYPEYVNVPRSTAELVSLTHALGGRVIAVGTTVVRALETAGDAPFDGWTDLVITPERGVQVVDGLVTGWHEPEASHLMMLEAIAGRALLERSYEASLAEGYLWHEFGDTHLIVP
jgi:S-adenosylmethionine:tRNA ribosyltransferase-isomerase